jgi:tRNA dimethylallyltransferase
VLAVVGPTASGKTRLSLELAERLNGEIVSADAMQVYRGMEIGTAAPTSGERARAPHHLVSFLSPDTLMAAGRFQKEARECIRDIQARGRAALVVGGSGL